MQQDAAAYVPLENAIPFVERVQCSHWNDQHIVVAFSPDRVAKLAPETDDKLFWERLFVKRVLNYVLDNRISPCLTRFIDVVQCRSDSPYGRMLWRQIAKSEMGANQRQHQSPLFISPPNLFPKKSNAQTKSPTLLGFVVERAAGVPMHEWAKQRHSLQQWRYVLFQLFYTFSTFNEIGLHHNDVHLENIFIDEQGWPQTIQFVTPNGSSVVLPAGREAPAVRFIDFDKASISRSKTLPAEWQSLLDTNPNLENALCTSYGLCNHHGKQNTKFDAFTLLCSLLHGILHYQYQIPVEVQKWIKEEAMPNGQRLYDANFEAQGGFLCRLSHHFNLTSNQQSYVPNDEEQRPTETILQTSSLFSSLYKNSIANNAAITYKNVL